MTENLKGAGKIKDKNYHTLYTHGLGLIFQHSLFLNFNDYLIREFFRQNALCSFIILRALFSVGKLIDVIAQ